MQSLAIKYRPKTFDDVTEQESTKIILSQQIASGEIKNVYLFVGSAGTGKTTCARIFANEINQGQGNPIELDAASNNGIDDVREIIQQAKTKALNSKYKVFIIDECHAMSNSAWQAMLKLIEEPPVFSIFIFCTTDPQKIPKTILSRVQRYDFQRISQSGISTRLTDIYDIEVGIPSNRENEICESLEYIAKIADGGMRDAITMLDKCLAYSKDLTLENVVKALGTTDYDTMFKLTNYLLDTETEYLVKSLKLISDLYDNGKDLKQFVKQYVQFLLDVCKYGVGCDWKYLQIPKLEDYRLWLDDCGEGEFKICRYWLELFVKLNATIKYSTVPKSDVETTIVLGYLGVS